MREFGSHMSLWIFKISSCISNAGMETCAPLALINVIVSNAMFHSKSNISKMLTQIIHILCFFWQTRYPRFCNELYWVHACLVARNLEVHVGLLHYCTQMPVSQGSVAKCLGSDEINNINQSTFAEVRCKNQESCLFDSQSRNILAKSN